MKRFIFTAIFFSLFFFAHNSFAATLFDTGSLANGVNHSLVGAFVTSTASSSDVTFQNFSLKFWNNSGNTTGTFTVNFGHAPTNATTLLDSAIVWLATSTGQVSTIDSSTFTSWANVPWKNFTPGVDVVVPHGRAIAFKFAVDNGGILSTNVQSAGTGVPQRCNPNCGTTTQLATQIFGFFGTQNVDLSIEYPSNGTNIFNDFPAWRVHSDSTGEGDNLQFQVWWSNNSPVDPTQTIYPVLIDRINVSINPDSESSNDFYIPKVTSLWSLWNGTTTPIYAKAVVYDESGAVVLGVSDEITFNVIRNESSFSYFTSSSPVIAELASSSISTLNSIADSLEVDCSAYSAVSFFTSAGGDAFSCYMRQIFFGLVRHIFLPHTPSVNFFSGAFAGLTRQFPFNIFLNFSEAVRGNLLGDNSITIRSQQSETNYDELIFSTDSSFGEFSYPVLTSSSLVSFIGQDGKDYFFLILESLMYLAFGAFVMVVLYERFKVK